MTALATSFAPFFRKKEGCGDGEAGVADEDCGAEEAEVTAAS
jgi:hypothetical protein